MNTDVRSYKNEKGDTQYCFFYESKYYDTLNSLLIFIDTIDDKEISRYFKSVKGNYFKITGIRTDEGVDFTTRVYASTDINELILLLFSRRMPIDLLHKTFEIEEG